MELVTRRSDFTLYEGGVDLPLIRPWNTWKSSESAGLEEEIVHQIICLGGLHAGNYFFQS